MKDVVRPSGGACGSGQDIGNERRRTAVVRRGYRGARAAPTSPSTNAGRCRGNWSDAVIDIQVAHRVVWLELRFRLKRDAAGEFAIDAESASGNVECVAVPVPARAVGADVQAVQLAAKLQPEVWRFNLWMIRPAEAPTVLPVAVRSIRRRLLRERGRGGEEGEDSGRDTG